jgi:hypothetical protein
MLTLMVSGAALMAVILVLITMEVSRKRYIQLSSDGKTLQVRTMSFYNKYWQSEHMMMYVKTVVFLLAWLFLDYLLVLNFSSNKMEVCEYNVSF